MSEKWVGGRWCAWAYTLLSCALTQWIGKRQGFCVWFGSPAGRRAILSQFVKEIRNDQSNLLVWSRSEGALIHLHDCPLTSPEVEKIRLKFVVQMSYLRCWSWGRLLLSKSRPITMHDDRDGELRLLGWGFPFSPKTRSKGLFKALLRIWLQRTADVYYSQG